MLKNILHCLYFRIDFLFEKNLGIEKLSLHSSEYRHSTRKSKTKRLIDSHSPKSHRSILSYGSHRPLTPVLRIPKMSKQALKRWLDARDAYLGHGYPYIIEKFKRLRRRRKRQQPKTIKKYDKMIDYEVISMFSLDSDRFSALERLAADKPPQSTRRETRSKTKSRSETSLQRVDDSLTKQIKSFDESPIHSISRLSVRKQEKKKTMIIRDHFDDKCIGTEISEPIRFQAHIEQCDQAIQVNLPRPEIELHHEFDISMVEGEKNQQIRSVQLDIEYSDKATETEFIFNFLNIEEQRKEEKEENKVNNVEDDDRAIRQNIKEQEEMGPYTESYNVQQEREQQQQQQEQPSLSEMSDNNDLEEKRNKKSISSSIFKKTNKRIVPLADLFQTTTDDETQHKQNGSQITILTSTESNISIHEQLQRYEETK